MRQAFRSHRAARWIARHVVPAMILVAVAVGLVAMPGDGIAALPATQSDTLCTSPAVVSLADESFAEEEIASPVASPVSVPLASPVASPVAGPVVADEDAPIVNAVQAIGACQNERRARTMTRFVTEGYLGDFYAGGGRITRDQFIEFARGLPRVPVEIVAVSAIEIDAEAGRASAEVVSTIGRQLFRATWSFVFVPQETADATGNEPVFGVWLADGVEPLPVEPPDGAREIEVELDENTYDPDRLRVRGPDIVIQARNRGDEDHELLVLSLADGVTTRDLLTAPGPELPAGVTVIGQITVPAGERGTLVLVGVEAGEYAIVDLLLGADGTPHLARGMEATLTVR
ncbi:MAG: hypothetical protein IT336_14440 [Thermomicrobiales bacterium]|nr:hypothetical protein [Thermomicrobiales bacterium]